MSVGKRSQESELPAFCGPRGRVEPQWEQQLPIFLLLGVLSLPDSLAHSKPSVGSCEMNE